MGNGALKGSTLGLRTDADAAKRDTGIESVPSGNASPAAPMSPIFKNLLREIFNLGPPLVGFLLVIWRRCSGCWRRRSCHGERLELDHPFVRPGTRRATPTALTTRTMAPAQSEALKPPTKASRAASASRTPSLPPNCPATTSAEASDSCARVIASPGTPRAASARPER